MAVLRFFTLPSLAGLAWSQLIVLSNDDGWAVAQIRAEYEALKDVGYATILSSPAHNWSGSGPVSVPAVPLTDECEYDSCPVLSPAYGNNASDPYLNYVNAAPSDAAHYGVTSLAPSTWGSPPDLLVSGPNVGNNIEYQVWVSGTIGAASRAVKDGVPAVAFSGSSQSTAEEAWTLLTTSPSKPSIVAARIYASLSTTFLQALFAQPPHNSGPLPDGVLLHVNFPPVSSTCLGSSNNIQWIFSRTLPEVSLFGNDVHTCNNGGRLPMESSVLARTDGCYATVSLLDVEKKKDADKDTQADVLERLSGLGFSCLPS
ncbi:survival protein sure-like phosphatase/nucleotidase [Cytidiella melzeri]|nr:survival protein sure-like phosphatase/nucleotidase [Cytidiella melzeri]